MHIDWWTLALQTANVLILIWLLSRFLYRPVVAIIDRRQQEAASLLGEAEAARQAANDARADADRIKARINTDRGALIAEATAAAQERRTELLTQASGDADKLRAEARTAIARETMAAQNALVDRAGDLALDIARRLLTRIDQDASLERFLDDLRGQIAELSPQTQALLLPTDAHHTLDVVTAWPLSSARREHVSRVIQDALGAPLIIAFRDDPALVAGIELRSQHLALRNSWRADLEHIREELKRDREQLGRAEPLARTIAQDR